MVYFSFFFSSSILTDDRWYTFFSFCDFYICPKYYPSGIFLILFSEGFFFYWFLPDAKGYSHIQVIYAESTDNEDKALEILGAWLLDAKASKNFFDGDSERLHRDILADAAKTHIERLFKTSTNDL
jgi:hypothetical protein